MSAARDASVFDPVYYTGAYPQVHKFFMRFPLRHYAVFGEALGLRPNPDFSPAAYLRYNSDVAELNMSPLLHYALSGKSEDRITKELPKVEDLPQGKVPKLRFDAGCKTARFAVAMHLYYPDLWPEFEETLQQLEIPYDLFVTITYRGEQTDQLADEIRSTYPDATVVSLPNKGRDILPFLTLVNAGAFDRYEAVCKIHTKKSPHREDGDIWRRHLINDILPDQDLPTLLEDFVADRKAAFWVADGQHYDDVRWWGSNLETTRHLLRRLEIEISGDRLSFPAGSIYWLKPLMIGMLKALKLHEGMFDQEQAQVDGTLAHALERLMGFLPDEAGQEIRQTTQIRAHLKAAADPEAGSPNTQTPMRPSYTSAFYLPQFHPIPENDAWWGKGFTEWRGVVGAMSLFPGHTQPLLPADIGFYDLRVSETLGEQAALAKAAGIDAFCVYHYWFNGRRVLEAPLENLLKRPEIEFPFYLCWANESWRRNWDGLSGEVLLDQTYADGFEEALVKDSLPYMRDPRYQRPDGTRPRFVIYRPEDMPDPAASVKRMRKAWEKAGIGAVELGAVCFHVTGENAVAEDIFDFWIEMPPHGLVTGDDFLVGGPQGNILGQQMPGGFEGLVYDYSKVIGNALSPHYVQALPRNTICGAMPSWDNTARRHMSAHIAYRANPASFNRWLEGIMHTRIEGSYRNEFFLNAWNEWAEKAVLEPSLAYGDLYLKVLSSWIATDAQAHALDEPVTDEVGATT
ncbi:glycoside hydrolase family 99-like domain-containing protein [Tateyamaria sp. ANG-S1]|uniref:glycoside hydrolase family 99-like domain-containing protein n=1 Tax=Tateyamaria sp. ANG-S1 TaxID=1577905 RepID=UPI001F4C63D3|nr:glycoside hydrolase family 99-like domain-containing protein [Tateyamaria sp. ANG-S1]